ncbi:unnamed protein product [Trichogramma brassicae]|uniref:Uncharacterized protein n=1 Tax=Trichogramma brassicae TaxID=86971 RepID=A0A6H5HVE0_9HYME|nr:unnamed protein product [Trichogramma brassicae]
MGSEGCSAGSPRAERVKLAAVRRPKIELLLGVRTRGFAETRVAAQKGVLAFTGRKKVAAKAAYNFDTPRARGTPDIALLLLDTRALRRCCWQGAGFETPLPCVCALLHVSAACLKDRILLSTCDAASSHILASRPYIASIRRSVDSSSSCSTGGCVAARRARANERSEKDYRT